ncbi:MAG: SCP-like extracellular [Ruminococcus sp.]|nr:SCP-like extracellular [Ruminococcus sp.]MDE6784031.1 SCP-like extracellular [Ruminococcus sp.]
MMNCIRYSFKKIISFMTAVTMIFAISAFPKNTSEAVQIPETNLKEMANELAFLVNEFRAENGLNPVYVVPYMNDMATVRARECIADFGHLRPDGSKFSTIIDDSIVPYDVIFENIAAGRETPAETLEQWKNSEKHVGVILRPDVTHMGVGVGYEENSIYQWYWEQNFAICEEDIQGQYIPTRYEITPQAEGDITGDAVVDSYDYIALADYIYKKKNDIPVYLNDAQLETADCFRDGLITEADAKVMVRYILGEYTTLPFVF